jgi:sterol desaturase/sphingolipid hydroxylase (fatty acid hydroxylase superfamily)
MADVKLEMRGQMRALGYYADFVVFPLVLLGLAMLAHWFGAEIHPWGAAFALLCGIFFWTFLEYAIHRFILHSGLMFSGDHDAHHASPKAMIATPTWLTMLIMVFGIYIPAILLLGSGIGLVFGFGVTFGYLVYSFAHYSLHQWNVRDAGFFYRWKRLHALHHFVAPQGNFGVTSSFWDHVFGTVVSGKRAALMRN